MEELLILLLQVASGVVELIVRLCRDPYLLSSKPDVFERWSLFACLYAGGVIGGLSLFFFRHTFFATPELRIANLIVSPVASAVLALCIAELRAAVDPRIFSERYFWPTFCYAIGFSIVRFAFAVRA